MRKTRSHTGAVRHALVEVFDEMDWGVAFREAVRFQRDVLVLSFGAGALAVRAFDAATADEATARRALRGVPPRFAWQDGDVQFLPIYDRDRLRKGGHDGA